MTGRVKALDMCQLHHLRSIRHVLKCLLLLLIQNDILCCPSVCQHCKGRQADCRYSGLSSIPSNFPQNTVFLYLSGNNISHICPNELIGLNEVAVLHLDNSGILYVCPKAFAECKKLWFLHLNNNQIKHLDLGTFEGLSNLHSLYLHNNEMAFVPRGLFRDLTSVQYLMLQSNCLSILGSGTFFGMISLRILNLDNNKISQISHAAFHHLNNLTCLFLGSNSLTHVPSSAFLALRNLERLSLSFNPIEAIPPFSFKGLAKLEFLSLKSANIKTIHANGFFGLKNLKKLILSNNNLENVNSKTFASLDNVMFLQLDRNKINSIADGTFEKMGSSLKILNLEFNNLTFLRAEVLKPLVSLTHLQANSNPWNCSCRLLGLIKWLASSSISLKLHCQNPSNLHGRHVSYAKWSLFTTCFSTTPKPEIFNNIELAGMHHSTTTVLMAWHKNPASKKTYEHVGVDTNIVTLWAELPATSASQKLYEENSSEKLEQTTSVFTAQIATQKIPVNLTVEEDNVFPLEAASISIKTSLICTQEVEKLNHSFDILLTFFVLACGMIIFLMYKIIQFRQKLKAQNNSDSGIEYYSFYQGGSYTITDPIQHVPSNSLGSPDLDCAQLSKPTALESQAQVILFEHSAL